MNINLNEMLNELTPKVKRSKRKSPVYKGGFDKLTVSKPSVRNNESLEYRNAFIKASELEREKIEHLLKISSITEYGFTDTDSFDRHDGWYYDIKGRKYIFEVKVRNIKSTDYEETVIDLSKYNYMLSQVYGNKIKPMLFVFFTDGKVLIEDLSLTKLKVTEKRAPKTTSGDQTMITKKFLNIPITPLNLHNE